MKSLLKKTIIGIAILYSFGLLIEYFLINSVYNKIKSPKIVEEKIDQTKMTIDTIVPDIYDIKDNWAKGNEREKQTGQTNSTLFSVNESTIESINKKFPETTPVSPGTLIGIYPISNVNYPNPNYHLQVKIANTTFWVLFWLSCILIWILFFYIFNLVFKNVVENLKNKTSSISRFFLNFIMFMHFIFGFAGIFLVVGLLYPMNRLNLENKFSSIQTEITSRQLFFFENEYNKLSLVIHNPSNEHIIIRNKNHQQIADILPKTIQQQFIPFDKNQRDSEIEFYINYLKGEKGFLIKLDNQLKEQPYFFNPLKDTFIINRVHYIH